MNPRLCHCIPQALEHSQAGHAQVGSKCTRHFVEVPEAREDMLQLYFLHYHWLATMECTVCTSPLPFEVICDPATRANLLRQTHSPTVAVEPKYQERPHR